MDAGAVGMMYELSVHSSHAPRCIPQIQRAGFKAQAWPVALNGRDLVAIAKTGR